MRVCGGGIGGKVEGGGEKEVWSVYTEEERLWAYAGGGRVNVGKHEGDRGWVGPQA